MVHALQYHSTHSALIQALLFRDCTSSKLLQKSFSRVTCSDCLALKASLSLSLFLHRKKKKKQTKINKEEKKNSKKKKETETFQQSQNCPVIWKIRKLFVTLICSWRIRDTYTYFSIGLSSSSFTTIIPRDGGQPPRPSLTPNSDSYANGGREERKREWWCGCACEISGNVDGF